MASASTDQVLQFWFKHCSHQPTNVRRMKRQWYRGGRQLDLEIQRRFGGLHPLATEAAMGQQQLDSRDALACVIVLDQFSRHLFRGSKTAFAFDQGAQAVTQRLLSTSDIEDLSPIEQVFLLHPFHHAEDLHLQHEGCNRLQRLITSLDLPWQTALTGFLQSFKEHALIVERFGRFPHRNRILGRKSSDAEQRFLDTQTRHFGQQHGTH